MQTALHGPIARSDAIPSRTSSWAVSVRCCELIGPVAMRPLLSSFLHARIRTKLVLSFGLLTVLALSALAVSHVGLRTAHSSVLDATGPAARLQVAAMAMDADGPGWRPAWRRIDLSHGNACRPATWVLSGHE